MFTSGHLPKFDFSFLRQSENDENNDSSLNDFLSQSWSGDYQKVSCNIRELLTFAKNHHH